MASITIRNLDEQTKQWLRQRAAINGRSMEEEARQLFAAHQSEESSFPVSHTPAPKSQDQSENGTSVRFANLSGFQADNSPLNGTNVLLIVCGGIASYKCLDMIRRLRKRGAEIRVIMTRAAQEFISPLTFGALTGGRVYSELFNRDDEHDIGHIRLPRQADLVVVAPATANMMAKMANGVADDLASTVLLANQTPVLVAPAMNPVMWGNPATKRNLAILQGDGVAFIGPNRGEMAESNEAGTGRMAEPDEIIAAMEQMLDTSPKPLTGKRAIVTSGPTHEPIDPVRYIANRSSGKQGHAIATALARAGAEVILVSGPVTIPDPVNVSVVRVETARQMQQAVEITLPADIAVFVAAVADWRTKGEADEKIKKDKSANLPIFDLIENPDILRGVGTLKSGRPELVIGFAAETENLINHARAKLKKKGADWIVANDVSAEHGVMGGDNNTVKLISRSGIDEWPTMSKSEVAEHLVTRIAARFETIDI